MTNQWALWGFKSDLCARIKESLSQPCTKGSSLLFSPPLSPQNFVFSFGCVLSEGDGSFLVYAFFFLVQSKWVLKFSSLYCFRGSLLLSLPHYIQPLSIEIGRLTLTFKDMYKYLLFGISMTHSLFSTKVPRKRAKKERVQAKTEEEESLLYYYCGGVSSTSILQRQRKYYNLIWP